MALTSPGVQVSVIDESFYTPAEPGTTPLIFVATKQDKSNPAGTGIAPGTTAANAGKVYLMSSQRELSETFGDPLFYTDNNGASIHGGEQNEYGLQAAYSFSGVANRAYVVRAPVDMDAITASATETAGKPANGAWWFDTNDSFYGIFEWNGAAATTTGGQTFTNRVPTVITDTTKVVDYAGADYTPKTSVGAVGDYALVAVTTTNKLWYKNADGTWVEVGGAAWRKSWPAVTGTAANPTLTIGQELIIRVEEANSTSTEHTITLTGTTVTSLVGQINVDAGLASAGVTAKNNNGRLSLYNAGGTTGGQGDLIDVFGDAALLSALGITAGEYYSPELTIAAHTSVPEYKTNDTEPRPTGSIWVKTTTPNLGANWSVKQYSSATDAWTTVNAPIYANNHTAIYEMDTSGGGAGIAEGSIYVQSNTSEEAYDNLANFKIYRKSGSGAVTITSTKITASTFPAGTYSFTMSESLSGQNSMDSAKTISFTATGATADADTLAGDINSAGFTNVSANVDSQNRVVISHALGGEIRIVDTDGIVDNAYTVFDSTDPTTTTNFYYTPGTDSSTSPKQYIVTWWKTLSYTASEGAPTSTPADGALWYSSVVDEVDMMIHNGTSWVGYHNFDHTGGGLVGASSTNDPAGPIVAASAPTEQSDGSALVVGDLWISTADLENYPQVYRWTAAGVWALLDSTDQTTENGVLFADARYNTAGANSDEAGDIADLLVSNYLDPDAPDPALYPKGMLLWNTRRSGFNVKEFKRDHIDINAENGRNGDESMAGYYANRWVTKSANNEDGSGSFGRKAQRKIVVQALQAEMNSNQDIRDDESRIFNLISTPGYPELIGEMVTLNNDRGLTAFVVGDTPMRLTPDSTSLTNWANNIAGAVEDNDDGAVTSDEYLGMYYPAGFTSDNAGNNIVVPASHMALRTIALNDQVAFPWFAPAGTRRGSVTNATASGYIDSEGEFTSVALNEGQRDTLYSKNINPISFINGAGLVIFGQKTRAANASSLDRVNVARLVVYLRSQLKTLAKPFVFEPNDKITRDSIKGQVESLLIELTSLRAIFDYLVVCDETNNTPTRIDKNELYVDVAIEPVKSVEFIYIPLRLKNTGEIASL